MSGTAPACIRLLRVARPSRALGAMFGSGLRLPRRDADPLDLSQADLDIRPDGLAFTPTATPASGWSSVATFTVSQDPFWHARSDGVLAPELASAMLNWLEQIDAWKSNDGGFYAAGETALSGRDCPAPLSPLLDEHGMKGLEDGAGRLFGTAVRRHGPVVAHRMTPGHGVGIHTDRPAPGEETHRVVVFLTRERALTTGGHFLLLEGPNPENARAILPLRNNTGIGFVLSGNSYHAVTIVGEGVRFSLVLSFRAALSRSSGK